MAIFHDSHHHGRAFHGHEARHLLEREKRDSHGSSPRMNVPEQMDNKHRFIALGGKPIANKAVEVETVYSQVYVTESKTFDGPATWVTETGTTPAPAPTSVSLNPAQASYASAKALANSPHTSATATHALGTPLQQSQSGSPTDNPTHAKGSPMQQQVEESASVAAVSSGPAKGSPLQQGSDEPTHAVGKPLQVDSNGKQGFISHKDEGMSAGEKAGMAFGIIIAIACVAGLIYFCFRRRKQQQEKKHSEPLNEKHQSANSFFGGTAAAFGHPAGDARGSVQSHNSLRSTRTASTAPRLSLRPVTQFLPNIMENRKSAGAGNALNVPAMSEKPKSAWERPSHNAQNPFSDAAVLSEKQARPESPPSNPFEEGDAAAVAAGRSTPNHSAKNSWESNEPPTPKSTKFGTATQVSVASGAAGPGPRSANNVHRVQLDFKPSMDDELELKSGQLVRMLHEYDDGWALCIRMDRSQQGVCPRTCLSKLPVKPRLQGPPPNGPNGCPMGPPPQGMRGPPPPNANMYPRPLTPTGRERSASMGRSSPAPQEHSRPRSQSVSAAGERPVSPLNTGMPARKPVPGQAL